MVSDLKKKTLSVLLVILLFSVVASLDVGLNMRINPAQAQPIPNMFVDPLETKNPLLGVGDTFVVNINISNVENLFGWQVNMTFNKEVVNCTLKSQIVQGPFLSDWFGAAYTTFSRNINYEAGYLLVACSRKPPYVPGEIGATGNGTLAYITFTVMAEERATLIAFGENTKLNTLAGDPPVAIPIEPFATKDGSFDDRPPQTNVPPVAAFEYTPLGTGPEGERIQFDVSPSYDPDAWLERYDLNYGDGTTETYVYSRERFSNASLQGLLPATVIHVYEHAGIYGVTLTITDNDGATATLTREVMVPGHDVAVKDVKVSYVAVMPGILVPVNVTVYNNGNYTEAFDVNAYFNETLIETRNMIDMPAYSETTLFLTWDTTGVALGKYLLKANASQVAGEIYIDNNIYIDGAITVALTNIVQFQTTIGGRIFNVQVESTSITAGFSFSTLDKQFSFDVAGQLGMGGFTNITIPMALLSASAPDAWTVKFDGSNIPYTITSNGTHYFIYFEYIHGAAPHIIEIIGETVATPPFALFTTSKTTALAGESVTFDASTSYDPDGTIESWNWNFGDGTTDTGQIVQHSFASHGIYTVTLTVKDDEQLSNSTQKTITVIEYPIASFSYTPEEPLVDQTINFDATASNPVGGTIINYAWEFGDGETGTGQTITHSYSAAGTYQVKLTVTDSEDLTNATTKTIIVKIHDIAITSLTASPSTVRIGQTVEIEVTVANQGNFTETFTITVYRNSTTIETQTVTALTAGNSQILTTSWNTSSVGPGAYTIKAETSIISGETRTDDNSRTGVTVTVQKRISSLTITPSSTALTIGDDAIITGTLTPTLQDKTITLQYRLVGQSWSTLSTMTTDTQGNYQFTWTPTLAGTYEMQAIWQGDASTEACQSDVQTISVKEAEVPPIPIEYVVGALAAMIILIAIVAYLLRVRKR